ncbi:MAG TPA: SMC family ATPase [Solirubrobacteraceae bacterium]
MVRPRRLELHGFTAFRDPQEIDFTDLDLFVITGPTGAGKTSLLDAVALALYGQVPRMGKQGLGQLVSHGKAEARILLEFAVDGDSYRVARRLPRSGAQQGRFERWSGEQWVDAVERGGIKPVNDAILDLVKLDFESFCKAIVLPQGEFARFLKGEPAERRKTLVALLGLGAYERMGALARDRSKELRIKGEQTRTILAEQYADATPEALAEADQSADATASAAETAGVTLSSARDIDGRRTRAVAHGATAAGLAERFAALAQDVLGEVEAAKSAGLAHRDASERCEAERGLLEAAKKDRADAAANRAEVVGRHGTPEEVARVADALERRALLDQRVDEAEQQLELATQTLDMLRGEHEARVAADVQAQAALEAAAAVEMTKQTEAQRLSGDRDLLQRRAEDAATAATEHDIETAALIDLEKLAGDPAADVATARATHTDAMAASEALRRDHLVVALVAGLEAGDPCPVCQRPLAEHPATDSDVERRLAEAKRAADSAAEAVDVAQRKAADAAASLTAAKTRIGDAARRLAAVLGDFADRSALETAATLASTEASTAEAARADAESERTAAQEHKHAAALAATKSQAELEAATREQALRAEGRAHATADRDAALLVLHEHFGGAVPEDAADRVARARAELREADEHADAASRAEAAAHDAVAAADEVQRQALAGLTTLDLRLGQLRTRAEGACADLAGVPLGFELGDLPEPSEARDERAEQLATWCSTAHLALVAAAREHDETATVAAREIVQLAAAQDLEAGDAVAALAALEKAEKDAIEARARSEESLRRLGERVSQRAQLEAAISEDAGQISVLDVLGVELRADHFVDFVIQETLDVLAVHASKELLRISDDRYSLVSDEGEFSVVDHVNADEKRSVKTLSGGETFMASLALALALSKHVSDLAGEGLGARLEAVFIDEGFGSLDPETLEEVIDALERLREDDLLIGVISHVPALAERIRVGLHVQKDGNRSVVVEAS